MMSDAMITVEGLGKDYRLGGPRRFDLRGGISGNAKALLGGSQERFWALRDVNFSLAQGEALGIIGRNGAGKSTLLKILSRITMPSEGRFVINGRVSSLLEVGTGFHPELSGRENIYLNGTILGMRRAEVKRKFDEIVEFSGVGRFLENPVKHYSSGQKVRLAFAVAAHLEPEVLIIDEVLAVGDIEFQRKCIGKMKDVASSGRTVLFVSHNMSAINSLCSRCLLLSDGRVEDVGDTTHIINRYVHHNDDLPKGFREFGHLPMTGDGLARLKHMRWVSRNGDTLNHAKVTEPIGLEIGYDVLREGGRPQPVIFLYNSEGEHIFTSFAGLEAPLGNKLGNHVTTLRFPADLFNEDTYYVSLWLATWLPHKVHQVQENVMNLRIMDDLSSSTRSPSHYVIKGALRPKFQWDINTDRSN
jgi:lipopolysaccharide transport system ATP-binding protein